MSVMNYVFFAELPLLTILSPSPCTAVDNDRTGHIFVFVRDNTTGFVGGVTHLEMSNVTWAALLSYK